MAEYQEEKFSINDREEDIVNTFKVWLKDSRTYHDAMYKAQSVVEKYYLGEQTDKERVANNKSDTVENRIFEATETLVPVATANAHQFVVLPGGDNELSVKKAEKLQKVLTRKYETLRIQEKLETITRKMVLFRFGVLKWVWSDVLDDMDVIEIDPRLILIPKLRVDPHDLPYKIEAQEYSRAEMEDYFPDADLDELVLVKSDEVDRGGAGEAQRMFYRVYEVWTKEMTAWISGNKVLSKMANPYWDFEGDQKEEIRLLPNGKKRKKTKLIFRNHLDNPADPYVFFTTFNIANGPVAPISLAEVALSIQDSINVQKRQIINSLRQMGNGQVLVDADAMSREEADNITNEEGLIIYGESVASQNKVRREAGVPLPSAHFANLQHSEVVFDNVMGVHSATRGAAAAKTLGQDILSRQQDFTRIDLITRVLNRGVDRLANGLTQLMKLYYTDTHVIKILGEEGAIEFIKLTQDDIEDHIEIVVKSGNQLPMDQVALRTEAVQLWQLGAIDPVTLFQRLGFSNPEKAAERLVAWKQGQLSQETQAKIAIAKEGAAAKLEAAGGGEAAGRKVETPANVLQRARQNLGGSAPTR